MAVLLDGRALAAKVRQEVKAAVEALMNRGIAPKLHVVLVGDDQASAIYVRNKEKACAEVGIHSVTHHLPFNITEKGLLDFIVNLQEDREIDGVLIQLPLPTHIQSARVIACIDPVRDVDGFHPANLGRLLLDQACLVPCTPAGILRLLDESGVVLEGRRAVVVGRSTIVGKPMALLLLQRHATVTICHSRTTGLGSLIADGDIVVAAIGKPKVIKGGWIKQGAVVVDVGVNRDENGNICGDVETDVAAERASAITPVPGGVGPMTIAYLLRNTVIAACIRRGLPPPW